MMSSLEGPNESQRAVVLTALEEFYCPVQVDDLNAYAAVFAPGIDSLPDFAGVVAAEASAWRSGSLRKIWICPSLTDVDGASNDTYLTLSNWSLENRLLIRAGDQARRVWLVRVLCDLYLVAEEEGSQDLEPIAARIRYHSESAISYLPAELVSILIHGVEEFNVDMIEKLREAAEDSYTVLAAKERAAWRQSAQELERLDDYRRLFGV